MKLMILSVFDHKAIAFMAPMFFRAKGEAIRSMMDAVATKDTNFCKYPDDYVMMHIGDFDDESGVITPCVPVPIITARECVPADPFPVRS